MPLLVWPAANLANGVYLLLLFAGSSWFAFSHARSIGEVLFRVNTRNSRKMPKIIVLCVDTKLRVDIINVVLWEIKTKNPAGASNTNRATQSSVSPD